MKLALTGQQRAAIQARLARYEKDYDPSERLLTTYVGVRYDYNSFLRNTIVHPIRESTAYAVALLDCGDPQHQQRAEQIIRRVLEFQVTDPGKESFGVWAKFLEEPLEKAPYLDKNWADFMAVLLLHMVIYHSDRLPADLLSDMERAIRRAAESIRRRNIGPDYTNISIMGSYVTMATAELYGDADLLAYAQQRFDSFYDYTVHHGGFGEYNSPTYTMVALRDMARMRAHIKSPQAREKIEKIYRMLWEELALHFHAPTRQWAGPYSRAYAQLAREDVWSFVKANTGGRLDWPVEDCADSVPAPCPEDLLHLFDPLDKPRLVRQRTTREDIEAGRPRIVVTTYLSPTFALGTVNLGDMWNQKNNLLAHWGSTQEPSYLRLRFLHDGYDFSSVRFWAKQREGKALVGMLLMTDGGDKHPSLDKIRDATIRASDLRIRWEFGGAAKDLRITAPRSPHQQTHIQSQGMHFRIAAPYACIGEFPARWEAGRDESTAYLDLVFYSGEERTFKLDTLTPAATALLFQVGEGDQEMAPADVSIENDRIHVAWEQMKLSFPINPATEAEIKRDCVLQQQASGELLERL